MSALDGVPEPLRTIIEERAHELYHERETAGDQGFSDSMEMARFIEDLQPEQLTTLRQMIQVCSMPERQSMLYGLITGAMIYKHGRNWFGKSAEDELLGHHENEIKKDEVDWDAHVNSIPLDQLVDPDLPYPKVPDEVGKVPVEELPIDQHPGMADVIPAADHGKWNASNYNRLCVEYGIKLDGDGGMSCTGCGVYVHSLTDRELREPGVEGCGSCQKKAKFG